ncbi:MAG: hypothetical protein QOH10_1793 [Actinomycetota bacterium]|nr:hypothetical protein [Actinomycetota bacterium]
MSNLQTHWSEAELLATDDVVEPLIVDGIRCHGGLDDAGEYVSPRTKYRVPATAAWQQSHREAFGTEIVDAPLATWPTAYPDVAQAKYLLKEGVRGPIVTTLTRIGTVEGFGAMIRGLGPGDLQRFFVEGIDGTCLAHLQGGLFEAQARDEAGWGDEAGHRDMWFAARDIAFEHPVTEDETRRMLERMGIPAGGAPASSAARTAPRIFDDLDPDIEGMARFMLGLLFIELSAFHTFAWAEAVLSDRELVAGDGEASRIVSYVRRDETPHVEYLKTALTEMRDRTFIGESGRKYDGREVIGTMWEAAMNESRDVRRPALLRATLAEVEHALIGNRRRDEILEGFHACGTLRPDARGELVPQ